MTIDVAKTQIGPAHVKACSVLLALAKLCFDAVEKLDNQPDIFDVAFDHWMVLHKVADLWARRRSTLLEQDMAEALRNAAHFVHSYYHPGAGRSFVTCDCPVSAQLRDLERLKIEDQTGVHFPLEVAA